MKRILLNALFLFLLINPAESQSPYRLDWRLELNNLAGGAVLYGAGTYLTSTVRPYSTEEISALNSRTFRGLDRVAIASEVPGAADGSDWLLNSSLALPALFLLPNNTRKDFGKIALIYGEVLLITKGLTQLTKASVLRPRPFVFNESISELEKGNRNARFSFFSGHTSMTAANCFFAAKVFSDYFPDSGWKPVVWGVAAAIPTVTGYLRVAAGRHYPTDVIVGYGVGAALGILIPQLHKNMDTETGLSFSPSFGGGRLVYTF